MNADGLNPLAIGLRIARNVAGGGDRAALQLEIARMELRRAEIATNLRQAVALAIADDEAIGHQQRVLQAKRAALRGRIQLVEVAYRLGDGNTEAMWQLWLTCDELDAQIVAAEAHRQQTRRNLLSLLFPPATALQMLASGALAEVSLLSGCGLAVDSGCLIWDFFFAMVISFSH